MCRKMRLYLLNHIIFLIKVNFLYYVNTFINYCFKYLKKYVKNDPTNSNRAIDHIDILSYVYFYLKKSFFKDYK